MIENELKAEISNEALATVAGYSALAGLSPLIPIPFVDDFIMVRIHRRLCRELFAGHDMYLSDAGAKTLTDSPSNLIGGAFRKLFLWPIKKLIGKVLFFLAIKRCADVAAAVFHEGWLLARALEQEYIPHELLRRGDLATLKHLRVAIIASRESVDPSPTQAAMKSAFGVSREVFFATLSSVKGALKRKTNEDDRLEAAEKEVAPIAQRIQNEINTHWSSGAALDSALRVSLDAPISQTLTPRANTP